MRPLYRPDWYREVIAEPSSTVDSFFDSGGAPRMAEVRRMRGNVPYTLSIDLGTTFSAAAVSGGHGPTVLGLGSRALQIPSVLFLTDNGFVVGETAERRGTTQPQRLVREFKRRLGDPIPLLIGGSPFSAEQLTARLLQWVIAASTEQMGEAPARLVVTHPANWGPFKMEVFGQVMTLADAREVQLVPEPVAAAAEYASRARVEVGSKLAMYDLGGGTFDVCVVEKTEDGFDMLGSPEGVEHLGGADLDQALIRLVMTGLRGVGDLDPDDPAAMIGLARLRRDCVEAKEALSADVDTTIPVTLPALSTTVRVQRSEFEALIRPSLDETIAAMRRALRSASVDPSDLAAIVLIGGSSRIPLVAELLQREFDRQPALDNHPKHDVVLGAVRLDSRRRIPHRPAAPPGDQSRSAGSAAEPASVTAFRRPIPPSARSSTADGPPLPGPADDAEIPPRRPLRNVALGAGVLAVLVLVSVIGLTRDDPDTTQSAAPSTSQAQTEAALVPQAPDPLPDDELLVAREGDVSWDIWRMSVEGGAAKRLTFYADSETRSSLSPDRRSLIYLYEPIAGNPDESSSGRPVPDVRALRVMAVDGSGDRRLFASGPAATLALGRPGWSPDGTRIASASVVRPGLAELVVLALDGSSRVTVAEAPRMSDPTFTPDGRSVTYWASERTDVDGGSLMTVPVNGSGPPKRLVPGEPGQNADPAWSPDGSRLAFRRTEPGGSNIWVADRDGKELKRLTKASGDDHEPTWSPDGRHIAFRSSRNGMSGIFVMAADGSGQRLVAGHPKALSGPAWNRR